MLLLAVAYFKFLRLSPDEAKVGDNYNVSQEVIKTQISTTTDNIPDNDNNLEFITQRKKGTFYDLLKQDKSWVCKVQFLSKENYIYANDFYVDKNKLKGEVVVSTPDLNGEITRSILVTDNVLYSWSKFDDKIYGAKISLDYTPSLHDNSLKLPFNLDTKIDYECTTWNKVDKTMFSLPEKVLFKDLNQDLNPTLEEGILYEE